MALTRPLLLIDLIQNGYGGTINNRYSFWDHMSASFGRLLMAIFYAIITAIPLGLILNELITNAFKYAMKKDELNNLSFYVEKFEDQYLMTVKDFGPGISDKIDLKKTKSIGLRLIRRLSKQLQGKMEYQYESGSEFRIYFKDTYMRKDIA